MRLRSGDGGTIRSLSRRLRHLAAASDLDLPIERVRVALGILVRGRPVVDDRRTSPYASSSSSLTTADAANRTPQRASARRDAVVPHRSSPPESSRRSSPGPEQSALPLDSRNRLERRQDRRRRRHLGERRRNGPLRRRPVLAIRRDRSGADRSLRLGTRRPRRRTPDFAKRASGGARARDLRAQPASARRG